MIAASDCNQDGKLASIHMAAPEEPPATPPPKLRVPEYGGAASPFGSPGGVMAANYTPSGRFGHAIAASLGEQLLVPDGTASSGGRGSSGPLGLAIPCMRHDGSYLPTSPLPPAPRLTGSIAPGAGRGTRRLAARAERRRAAGLGSAGRGGPQRSQQP